QLRAADQPNAVHAFSLGGPLPSGLPEWLLGLSDDRAFARALDEARAARALAGRPGPDAQRISGEAQGDLAPFEGGGSDPARADLAATLGGVLAFQDSRAQAGGSPPNTDRALAAFRRAVEVDANADAAAYDLELLLHRETAAGIRHGGAPTPGGGGKGRRGAAAGAAGSGY
ncbi:MAG: hypothetical protein QOF54_804, partial [Solirubrobacteraceae bacterium]|nr:hypothetical protein [Solirubrobacteraceae bacterium]